VRFVGAAIQQVVKLFVTDWTQTAGIALILVVGLLLARQLRSLPVGFAVAILLGLHLVFTTSAEARRRRG
jgi:multidrug transporter EmrE-like cation transporter